MSAESNNVTIITINFAGPFKPGTLPMSLRNPDYWTEGSRSSDALGVAQRYITEAEWAALATGANKSSSKHSYMNHPCGFKLLMS